MILWFPKSSTDLSRFLSHHGNDTICHFKGCLQVCILFLLSFAEYQPTPKLSDLKELFIISYDRMSGNLGRVWPAEAGSFLCSPRRLQESLRIHPSLGGPDSQGSIVGLAPRGSSRRARSPQFFSCHSGV